jgi:hypothetical protein
MVGACCPPRTPHRNEVPGKTLRHHHVADPQGREKNLVESADVEHAPGRIQALKRGEGSPGVAELAVVVILQDPGTALGGPVQQRQAPVQAHRDTRGELMRRRHVRQAGVRRTGNSLLHHQAVGVHRNVLHIGASRNHRPMHAGPAGILEPCDITRVQQYPARQLESLLGRRQHDDLLRSTPGAACRRQVLGNCGPQRRVTRGGTVIQLGDRQIPVAASGQSGPESQGELVHGRHPRPEGPGVESPGWTQDFLELDGASRHSPRNLPGRTGGAGLRPNPAEVIRNLVGHIAA